jgi:O-antigen/teichoic acid export membrane protein
MRPAAPIGLRAALLLSTGERYFTLLTSFVILAVVSRILTPAEIGVSVIGSAVVALSMAVREFASPNYLIQHQDLTEREIRGTVTMMMIASLIIAGSLAGSAPWLAVAYGEERLVSYLRVIAISIVLEFVSGPILSLLRRDLAFGTVAAINMCTSAAVAIFTISLAWAGFGYMSFAWGWLSGAAVGAVAAFALRGDVRLFRPCLDNVRDMVRFGGFNGMNSILFQLYDSLPYLAFGRILSLEAVAFYNRAMMICLLPNKLVLGGVTSVIFPTFSAEARAGRDLKGPYLTAIQYITGFQWPSYVVLAVLAHPVVVFLLGDQWLPAVPLVRIMALASLFSFAFELNYPVLVALGGIRDLFRRSLIAWPISGLVLIGAAFLGLTALACGLLIVVPFQAYLSLHFVRRRVSIEAREIALALWRSAIVTAASAAGPATVVIVYGSAVLSLQAAVLAACLSGIGWLLALRLTRHPLYHEVGLIAAKARGLVLRSSVPAVSG